jgi:transcriptional regulator with XRE-family HTH domain
MTVGERLKQARKAAKYSGERLGAVIGVSKGQISNIENGTSDLTRGNAIVFADELGVRAEWLLTGKGDMYQTGRQATQHAVAGRDIGVQAGRDVTHHQKDNDLANELAACKRENELLKERIKDKEQMIELLLKR